MFSPEIHMFFQKLHIFLKFVEYSKFKADLYDFIVIMHKKGLFLSNHTSQALCNMSISFQHLFCLFYVLANTAKM